MSGCSTRKHFSIAVTVAASAFSAICFAFLASSTVSHAAGQVPQQKSRALERAIASIHSVVAPVTSDQKNGQQHGKICATCTPAPLSDWRPNKFYSLAADRTNEAQQFLRHMRVLLAAAACDRDRRALREMHWFDKHTESTVLTEAEAVVLGHRAKRAGLDLNFRTAVRTAAGQATDTVENWTEVSRVSAALRSGCDTAAVRALPALNELCHGR